jgi:hypothetical protein
MTHVLVSIGKPPPRPSSSDVFSICFLRNERLRIPHFVKHYRSIGVDHLLFIDNGSTDGTPEWLLDQPDCYVFSTQDRYSEARQGTDWANALLRRFAVGHWCLLVDADELFVYPHYEHVKIQRYTSDLERSGHAGVLAFMLDMYPKGPLLEADLRDDDRIFDTATQFDSEYAFQVMPTRPGKAPRFPGYRVIGGPRQRWIRPVREEMERGWVHLWLNSRLERLLLKLPQRVRQRLIKIAWRSPQTLQKVPLVHATSTFRWGPGAHTSTPVSLAPQTAVLLHYKFLADFHTKVEKVIREGQHYLGGAQYLWYREMLDNSRSVGLSNDTSALYEGSATLANLGLFQSLERVSEFGFALTGRNVS